MAASELGLVVGFIRSVVHHLFDGPMVMIDLLSAPSPPWWFCISLSFWIIVHVEFERRQPEYRMLSVFVGASSKCPTIALHSTAVARLSALDSTGESSFFHALKKAPLQS